MIRFPTGDAMGRPINPANPTNAPLPSTAQVPPASMPPAPSGVMPMYQGPGNPFKQKFPGPGPDQMPPTLPPQASDQARNAVAQAMMQRFDPNFLNQQFGPPQHRFGPNFGPNDY